ncbi:alpha/beta fold hydrolase [Halomonas campaniensis]|uniref:alpha/beta fold hydrolase n=1 Tax=Halomonas campaniensis TaxID=213554 RepID=UPI0035663DA5
MTAFPLETPAGGIHVARWRPASAPPDAGPIVLLHDSLGCIALWRDFPALLAEASGREVIAYDRLGYGESAPCPGPQPATFVTDEANGTFATLRESLALERFALLGHSVGGSMAIEAAGQHADGCEALITVAAQAFLEPRTLAGIREAEAAFAEPGAMRRLERYHGDKAEWVLRSWVDNWHSEAFDDWHLNDALPRVRCPTLAIHGEHDEFGSLAQPRRIASRTPGPAEPSLLPSGHVPHRECPEVLADIVARFLAAGD